MEDSDGDITDIVTSGDEDSDDADVEMPDNAARQPNPWFSVVDKETYANQCQTTENPTRHARSNEWSPVSYVEMRAFIGLVLAMGIVKKTSIESYWEASGISETPNFRDRQYNSSSKRSAGYDPLHKINPVVVFFNEVFELNYRLSQNIVVDERIVGFKGRHVLKQYISNKKAHRWGAKLFVLAESRTGYTHQINVYKGKRNTERHPNGQGYKSVMDLVRPHFGKNHHVTMDNWFSSPKLMNDLRNRGTYATGTVIARRKGLPASFKTARLPKGSVVVKSQRDLLAILTVRKVNSKGRVVSAPSVVHKYNQTMGGVDLGDQLLLKFEPQFKGVKLWRKILFNLLTTATVNAYICYRNCFLVQRKLDHVKFQNAVVRGLIGDFRGGDRRRGRRPGNIPIANAIRMHFLDVIPDGKRRKCVVCSVCKHFIIIIHVDMDENHPLGSNVDLYQSLRQLPDDHNDVTDIQNSDTHRVSSESKKVSFKEEQQPNQVIKGYQNPQNASSQSPHRTSSSLNNIQSSSHGTPNKDQQILSSNIAAHNNVNTRMPNDPVNVSSSRNRSHSPNDHNFDQHLRTQPESTAQYNSPNKKSNDTETDAKPMTPYPTQLESPQFGAEGGTYEQFKKTEEMLCFENNILRPKDHYDQPLTPKHLMDMVIVYAKSDYQKANNYMKYLKTMADNNGMEDTKIVLYTSEDFPNNDVKVVEEVVNRSMRVLMLLSANFANEVNLNFIKEETIGMTRLQELPPQEQISLFATTIMNRKKNCIRPVHTVPRKERNQSYEDAMALEFLKKAREDRLYHMNELKRHQALDNPYILQISEKDRAGQFLRSTQGELDMSDKANKDESLRNNTFRSIDSKQHHSIRKIPVRTSNGGEKSARSIPLENSSVVCASKQKVEPINGSNRKPIDEPSCITSGYVSNLSCENVVMGKEDSLPPQNSQNIVPLSKTVPDNNRIKRNPPKLALHIQNMSESFDPAKISSVEKDGMSSLEHGDEEEDKSADLILPKTSDGGESPPSLMDDSLVSDEIKVKQDKFPPKSHLGYNQQDVILQAKMKLMDLEGPGDVRESKVSYSGPSGRSGIRTGASPGYGEYLVGTPSRRRPGNSHFMDNSDRLSTQNHTTNRAPHFTGYPPPQSIHYHYHYPEGVDVEADQGPGTLPHQPESRGRPSSVRRRLSSPNRVNSGPIFNIQGCATVQIGDANTVTGNQNVEATNNNRMNDKDSRNNRNEQRGDWSPESPDSQRGDGSPESAGIIMEEPTVYGGQPEDSLNMLSPSNDHVKKVDYESSDNNSDEDNSNIQPESKGLDSAEMFDQNKTEKAILKDEIFQKKHTSEKISTNEKEAWASHKDINSMENSTSCLNTTSLKSSNQDSPNFSKESWLSVKHTLGLPFPDLPYYIDGEVKLTQSNAILRYIARKYDLLGRTTQEVIDCDVMFENAVDFRNATTAVTYNPNYEKLKDKYLENIQPKLERFENFLGDKSWFAGNSVRH
ncbi:Glutathione S-transferase Mu 1,Glutathione S-transferase Mu 5,Glutathione S-transferase Mu 2,Glutathione S-transferase [Mytilus coruscus]|uniref:Glutathione S-transferase Mu 1,Glutathione S-transferase Mu 5,Glutathione S-transferase Mu 2,Glutathione S-transferase n=1 Tax=Mytilus coruscus TaxID=42192 RepID=A0A6J8CKD5_MYTCO|nr:Glutathione S-transferase Mu 1,Glutathione S-transferase Mu 5,Glutathione S-transferase Mu 2,Glutathione S-transferase [Mytilus coruscus]